MSPCSVFGNRLRELRILRGLTQSDLAELMHITATTISRYELGEREPSIDSLNVIADFFDVDFNYLLGGSEKVTPQSEEDLSIIHRLHALDSRGKATVLNVLDYEYSLIETK